MWGALVLSLLVATFSIVDAQTGSFHELIRNKTREVIQDIQNANQLLSLSTLNITPKQLYFNQTVDHFGSQQGINGTWFNQFFLLVDDFYKVGGPVILYIEGEGELKDSSVTSDSLVRQVAQQYNGLLIGLEHRFYGTPDTGRSIPTFDFSNESLKLLTSQQAIEDLANFIRKFPSLFPEYNLIRTSKWISFGGSYSGSLSAWLIQKHPDLVFAAHSSSAPVIPESNFWRYSYAVEEGMNHFSGSPICMQGWTRAVQALDETLQTLQNNAQQLKKFKSSFWLSQISNLGDFGAIVTTMFALTVQYGPGYNYLIDRTNDSKGVRYLDAVCDGKYLPAFTNQTATRSDLLAALQNLTITFLQKVGFKGDSDPSIYYWNTGYIRDRSLSNNWYLWYWQACNEFGYNQVAQSVTASSNQLISNWSTYSQSISLSYAHWMCKTQGLSPTGVPNTEYTTKYYNNGTNITTPRILWVNGQLDPWHWLSNYKAAPDPTTQTSFLYLNATHCNDLWGRQASFSAYQNQFYDQLFSVYDSWMATDFNPTGPEEISAVSSSLDTTKIVLIAAGGSTLVIGLGIIAYMKVKKHAYLQVQSLISQGSTMKGDRSKVNSSSTTRREMSATPV